MTTGDDARGKLRFAVQALTEFENRLANAESVRFGGADNTGPLRVAELHERVAKAHEEVARAHRVVADAIKAEPS